MASPQTENGYTRIANEIMEAFVKIRINGECRQVIDFILRKTYGYNKKEDRIALSQFVLATGLKKSGVCKALNKAYLMNIITQKHTPLGNIYRLNKDFETWKPLPKKVPITQKGNESLPKSIHTKDNYTKDNNTLNKKMKKNTFGKYREDMPSDSMDTIIDADSGEVQKDKMVGVDGKMKELIEWASKRSFGGKPFLNIGKQRVAISNMKKAGISPNEIMNRWAELEVKDYYVQNGLDFMSVANSFDKKR